MNNQMVCVDCTIMPKPYGPGYGYQLAKFVNHPDYFHDQRSVVRRVRRRAELINAILPNDRKHDKINEIVCELVELYRAHMYVVLVSLVQINELYLFDWTMTSLEERFSMINTCSDERAAGVISGSDPYRELELYLEKVNEEIGEVFDKWGANSRAQEPVKWRSNEEPSAPIINEYRSKKYPCENDNFGQDLNLFKSYSLPIRRQSRSFEKYLDAWSKSLLAEFNTIIQDEHYVPSDNAESADDDYDEVAGDSSDEDSALMSMKYTINKRDDYRASPTVSPSTSEYSSESSGNGNRRTPPYISRIIKNKQRSQIATIHNKHDPVLVNVKIYPTEQARLPQVRKSDYAFHNGHHAYTPYECRINQLESRSKQQVTETGTQTSPAESRSSSFTWISDCSEDDHSSTTSSTEDSRRLGDSSGDSTPVKDEPESGIGTASPPRHCRYNGPSGVQKYRRKEVWEKLRKRQNNSKINLSATNGSQSSTSESHVRRNSFRNPSISVESSSDPDLTVFRTERPTCLPFASSLSPESSRETLPSPSATSLKLHMEPSELAHELSGKSSSAPLLLKHAGSASSAVPSTKKKMKQSRFHSEKLLVEIEATEACKWLRAAGFPQYAQMYEDMQFPIDVNSVQKDHQFLEPDALQSLFRRLQALNKCANMKVEFMPANKEDESDSDTECALSENWLFQPESRRWSRICDVHHITLPTSTTDENHDNVTVVLRNSSLPPFAMQQPEGDITVSRFRRSGSERLRDGAKAFLRRVESLKSKRRKQKNREGVIISGPQVVDVPSMEAKIKELNCVDVTPPESPFTPDETHRPVRRYLSKPESDFAAFSDSEITVRQSFHDSSNNNSKMLLDVSDLSSKQSQCSSRSGSQDSQTFALVSPIRKKNESPDAFAITEGGDTALRQKTTVARWHSFQRNSARPSSLRGQSINSLTVGQILVLRKLSLLKLTAIMERYCPSHRTTGWNWELPKFIRKAKIPDYKDKSVFGVPLLANVQQSGDVLPEFIIEALEWLRMNALDQVGIFRKSGGRSRINKLKMMAESRSAKINFDNQQPHDVADMVKQYFRELPDALLTNKLSETFVAIFQYVPDNLRTEAVQCALILLPDEHREALLILLDFLYQVAQHSYANQMSASNLAICLAPSLFYWTHTSNNSHIRRSSSMSPKRLQKSSAFPDVKELGQNIAAHECLYFLIKNHLDLFMVTEEIMTQCHFSYMDESVPVSLEELGEELQQDWRGYLNMCRNALLKEVKEKNRGWVISTTWEDVEIAYKKVRDGHPLRLWRVCTEVEAPPKELLFRVLRERHVWDANLLRSKIVQKLEPYAELFQYVTKNIDPLPPKDFCVIRSWKTDLSKGGCMVVETSVEHSDAEIMPGGVRGIVLASRYLIEPCGSGKSRILHLSRVDIKGRGSEWYNKCYGHMCAQYLLKIRNSFQRMTEGPESKV